MKKIFEASFAGKAAVASLALPLILIIANSQFNDQTASREAIIIMNVTRVLLVATGVVLGIIGLIGGKKNKDSSVVIKSVIGIVINSIILLLFAFAITVGILNKHQKQQESMNENKSRTQYGSSGWVEPGKFGEMENVSMQSAFPICRKDHFSVQYTDETGKI